MTYTSVVCVLGVFLAFVLGDSLRMAWLWVSGPYTEIETSVMGNPVETYYWWSSAIPKMMDNLTPHILEADSCNWFYLVMNLFVITAIAVWTHSLLIIGGTLFRKYSFVISCLVFILFWVIFVKTMHYFELSMFTSTWENGRYVSGEVGIPAYFLAVLLPLLYALLILADSSVRNRSLWVGLLSVPASFIQLTGYGTGFLSAVWHRLILKEQGEGFDDNQQLYK